jgi:hypothetical protein
MAVILPVISVLLLIALPPFGAVELTGASASGLFLEMCGAEICWLNASAIAEIVKGLCGCAEQSSCV